MAGGGPLVRRYNSLGDLPLGGPRRAIAIGTFDGVHCGHREVIELAVHLGRRSGLRSMALTFDPNPIAVLRPKLAPALLTPPPLKAELIAALGVDELLVVPFNRAFSRVGAPRFAEMLTAPPLGGDAVVVGANFRYGHRGTGTADSLRQFGRGHGLRVEVPDVVVCRDDKPISSTRVRRLIATGQVSEVCRLLGRPHLLDGVVERGDGRGRGMGFATANLALPDGLAVPDSGVYAGRASVAGRTSAAAINVGTSPTFAGAAERAVRVEAHLLEWEGGDLYGLPIRVEFLEHLRREERFASVDALVAQIRSDVGSTRRIVRNAAAIGDGGGLC